MPLTGIEKTVITCRENSKIRNGEHMYSKFFRIVIVTFAIVLLAVTYLLLSKAKKTDFHSSLKVTRMN